MNRSKHIYRAENGFTLVELSIVLVIIGLIVGGIVGGQSLIHSAKINKTLTQVQQYKTAVRAFSMQYDALPGDMTDASDYWSCGSCNGDGNQKIIGGSGGEGMQFWKHLQLANILQGNLTGGQDYSGAPAWASIGGNIPEAPFSGTGFAVSYPVWGNSGASYGKIGNHIKMASPAGNYLSAGAITPADAASIDKKIDDGAADSGNIRPTYAQLSDGSTTDHDCYGGSNGWNPLNASSGSYNLSSKKTSCALVFFLD